MDGALEDLRVLFSLTHALREEPTLGLSVQLLRIAIASYLLDVFRLTLPRCPAPAEAFDSVSPDAARGAVAFGLQGELAAALWVAVNTESFFERQKAEVSRLLIPGLKLDAAHLVRELGNYVEIARKPYPEAIELAQVAEARGDTGILGRDGGIITATMMTTLPIVEEARHASRVALAKLGAKCLEYRREHGKYPGSLRDLAGVDLDPLTERPFILEVLEDGIRLRSEKSDEVEDGNAIEWVLTE